MTLFLRPYQLGQVNRVMPSVRDMMDEFAAEGQQDPLPSSPARSRPTSPVSPVYSNRSGVVKLATDRTIGTVPPEVVEREKAWNSTKGLTFKSKRVRDPVTGKRMLVYQPDSCRKPFRFTEMFRGALPANWREYLPPGSHLARKGRRLVRAGFSGDGCGLL